MDHHVPHSPHPFDDEGGPGLKPGLAHANGEGDVHVCHDVEATK